MSFTFDKLLYLEKVINHIILNDFKNMIQLIRYINMRYYYLYKNLSVGMLPANYWSKENWIV